MSLSLSSFPRRAGTACVPGSQGRVRMVEGTHTVSRAVLGHLVRAQQVEKVIIKCHQVVTAPGLGLHSESPSSSSIQGPQKLLLLLLDEDDSKCCKMYFKDKTSKL